MKKKIILGLIIIVSISFGFIAGANFKKEEVSFEDDTSKPKQIDKDNMLSMLVEQTIGSGDYQMEERTSWPTDGYIFNAKLSKCENGGELGWDDTNKVVTMTGNMSDRCYAYFDILPGDIDVSFVGSTSTTLKINVISEDGSLSKDYNTYYYSTDGGSTYVSSVDNTYSVAYSENEITSFSVYASNTKYGDSNVISKNVFNGGTVKLLKNLNCSDDVCGYYDSSEPKYLVRSLSNSANINNKIFAKKMVSFNYYYKFNTTPGTDNMNGYLFNNSDLDLSGETISGSGSNDYYFRSIGTTSITNGVIRNFNNFNVISDGGSLTWSGSTVRNVSNLYFSLTDTTLNLTGAQFRDINGTLTFNLNGNISLVISDIYISGDSVVIKVVGSSNILPGTISGFGDLSSDGVTFLKALVNNTSFSATTLSFDFNGFTFTLDEAQTYINSLS